MQMLDKIAPLGGQSFWPYVFIILEYFHAHTDFSAS